MTRITSFIALTLLATLAPITHAADWPQWRGPNRDGISTETGLLKAWPKDGPKLLWQVSDMGEGYSTPAVVGKHLYLLTNKGMDDEVVECRTVADGKVVWSQRIGKVGNPNQRPSYPAARSTPTVEGESMWALGSDGDLICLETASGKPRWQKNLRTDFGGKPGEWAYAESPLIDGDVLVVTPGGADATLVALKKETGDVIWKSAVPGGDAAGYASVIATEAAGIKQYVQFLAKGQVGVDAKDGKFLWRYERTAKGSPANMLTAVAHDSMVYSGAPRSGGGAVKLTAGDGGTIKAEEVYFDNKLPTAIGGAVLVGDHLYGTTSQVLVCADFKTGKIAWTDRCIGAASVCVADGMLYLHGENGEAALVEAKSAGFSEKGRFTPPGQPDRGKSKAWAYPVVAGGKLFIRDMGVLWCYDIAAPTSANARE